MRFRVHGLPAPQGSKRLLPAGGKRGGRLLAVESSRAVGPWREAVRAEAQRRIEERSEALYPGGPVWAVPLAEATSVTIVFVLPRPRSHFGTGRNDQQVRVSAPRYPACRPDVDKLARAVLDGLVSGGVMADDAQVISLSAVKVYAADGDAPGAVIDVEAMT